MASKGTGKGRKCPLSPRKHLYFRKEKAEQVVEIDNARHRKEPDFEEVHAYVCPSPTNNGIIHWHVGKVRKPYERDGVTERENSLRISLAHWERMKEQQEASRIRKAANLRDGRYFGAELLRLADDGCPIHFR